MLVFFFFFQAEDGIRDLIVTGVQTCALPILLRRAPATLRALLDGLSEHWMRGNEGPETFSPFDVVGHLIDGEETDWIPRRSEERRVGKECRSRWSPYH